jgi:hypothetical protein
MASIFGKSYAGMVMKSDSKFYQSWFHVFVNKELPRFISGYSYLVNNTKNWTKKINNKNFE